MGNVAQQDSAEHIRNVLSTRSSGFHNKVMGSFQARQLAMQVSKPLKLHCFSLVLLFPRYIPNTLVSVQGLGCCLCPLLLTSFRLDSESADIQIRIKV